MAGLHWRGRGKPNEGLVKMAKVSTSDERKLAVALDRLADEDEQHETACITISILRTDKDMKPLSPVEVARIDWGLPIDPMVAPPAAASALAGVKVHADEDGRAFLTAFGYVMLGNGENHLWFSALIECDADGVLHVTNEKGRHFFKREY